MAGFWPTSLKPYLYGLAAGATLFVSAFIEPGLPGYAIFATWAIVCAIASARRDLTVWVVTTFGPLCLVAAGWPGEIAAAEDPFGFKVGMLQLFSGMCLVAAMTCVLALVGPYAARDDQ